MTDSSSTTTEAPADGEHVGIEGGRMVEIMQEGRRQVALRITAESMPGGVLPAEACERYGIKPDGSIAEGGLTEAGREFADECIEAVQEAVKDIKGMGERKRERKAGPPPFTASDLGEVLDALQMRGPMRAAIRAGAQALAAALNDGGADNEGLPEHGHDDDDTCTVTLGAEPFVLVRVNRLPGTGMGGVSVVAGGGAVYAKDPGAALAVITVEKLLALAAEGIKRSGTEAEQWDKIPGGRDIVAGLRSMLGDPDLDLQLMVVDEAGNVMPADVAADVEAGLAEADAEAKMRQAPEASGSGPSTEMPTPPNMPRPSEDAPGAGPGSDDGWGTPPSTSSPGGSDGGSSASGTGGADSSGDSPGCAGGE